MKLLLFVLSSFISLGCIGQNLVLNASFENYDFSSYPCNFTTSNAQFNGLTDWFQPTAGTSDLFNSNAPISCYAHPQSTHYQSHGNHYPRTGDGTIGLISYGAGGCGPGGEPDYREYAATTLLAPLVVGETYYAEMYVSLADKSDWAHNNLGMYFSEVILNDQTICSSLGFVPQINENTIIGNNTSWTKVSGCFVAEIPARYLYIGNFYSNSNTSISDLNIFETGVSMYYIDDVLVRINTDLNAGLDTVICRGESVDLDAGTNSFIGWAVDTLPETTFSTASTLSVTPQQSTTYFGYRNCDTVTYSIQVNPIESFDLGLDSSICESDSIELIIPEANNTILWSDSSTNPNFIIDSPGEYWVQLSDRCDTILDTIRYTLTPSPQIDLGEDTVLCINDTMLLDASSLNVSYLWQDGSHQRSYVVVEEGEFWVQLSHACGVFSDTINIMKDETCICTLEMPNAFTPNNDNLNDRFSPVSDCPLYNYNLKIYNRWGTKVFQSTNLQELWDGTFRGADLPQDNYTYFFEYAYQEDTDVQSISGSLTLIR